MSNGKGNEEYDAFDETQDELSAHLPVTRATPRNSLAELSDSSAKPTPYANLRQLAGLIRRPSTPRRRKSSNRSNALARGQRSITPSSQKRAASVATRALQPISGNRSNPTTPHAVRALQQRRTTPGFERRKSGRIQRETPRDILRNLSKALARTTKKPIEPTAFTIEQNGQSHADEVSDDELSPEQPTLTLPLVENQQEEDSFDVPQPRLSMPLLEDDYTVQSTEIGRQEAGLGRLSLRQPRNSDRDTEPSVSGDLSMVGQDDTSVVPPIDDMDELSAHMEQADPGGDTGDLRKLLLRPGLQQAYVDELSPEADGGSHMPFVLQIPDLAPRQSLDNMKMLGNSILENLDAPLISNGEHNEDPLQSAFSSSPVTIQLQANPKALKRTRQRRPLQHSRFGIAYSGIPAGVTKSVANTFARTLTEQRSRLNKETLSAIREAGDLFLAQLGGDLSTFARHGGRKNIEESDVVAAMTRQRHVTKKITAFSLAQQHMPLDLVHELRIPIFKALRRRRKRCIPASVGSPEY